MNIILSALCNPTRLQLIQCISQKPKSVSEMISICGLSQSAVSQHLAKLRRAGLVITEKKGKTVYYHLAYPQLGDLSSKLQRFIQEVGMWVSKK
ncbi:MAG: hypothetical protein KatS3mg089_0518 [Patescibacteria group bacterium]|nr:MAG: hypothetical protein KatS3mg089_0518 [Patescibacteria group bacterium]